MKVASYNIHKCRGVDGLVRPDRTIGVIKELRADLVALQEVDKRFGRRTGFLDPDALRRETGLHLLVQSDIPNGHGWHGNALLIRGQPKSYRRMRLALPGAEPRGAVVAEIDLGEGPFRVIAAHFGLLRRSRLDQADAILQTLAAIKPMPTILLGDLNEWRRNRSGLKAFETIFGPQPLLPSYPSRRPVLALDRVMGWPIGLIGERRVHDSHLARIASDHLPLTARLDFAAGRAVLRAA